MGARDNSGAPRKSRAVVVSLVAASIVLQVLAIISRSTALGVLAVVPVCVLAVVLALPVRLNGTRQANGSPPVRRPVDPLVVPDAPPAPADLPPARGLPQETPARPAVRMPATMDPGEVALTLLEASTAAGPAVAAHLWLEDPSSATLRQIASVGSMVPAPNPRPLDDDPLGLAVQQGVAHMTAVANLQGKDGSTTLWRFAVPIHAGDARGVVAVDFTDDQVPDTSVMVDVTARLRGALSGALALDVAQTEIRTARMLLETARELSRQLDPDEVVSHTLARAIKVADAVSGSIMLVDPDTGAMRIEAAIGLPDDIVRDTVVAAGEGIAGWVLATGKPVLVEDLPGREHHYRRTNVRSAVSVPISDEDGILGVLNVGSRAYPARFTSSHMSALEILGTQTAVALRNARALHSARDLYFATLRALTLAMETKDPYARGGTDRVVEYTTALGKMLGLEELEMQSLEVAALLHDIGMSAAGESVSTCSRPLSTFERGLLKLHPVLAAEVLEEVPALRNVIPIVYHHHEWYDGQGYVVGLAGETIPLGARILAVADAFVAMTSPRPYRPAMAVDAAVGELTEKAGTQFDPEVVDALIDLLRRDPSLTRGVVES